MADYRNNDTQANRQELAHSSIRRIYDGLRRFGDFSIKAVHTPLYWWSLSTSNTQEAQRYSQFSPKRQIHVLLGYIYVAFYDSFTVIGPSAISSSADGMFSFR